MENLKKELIIKSAKERFARYGFKKTSMSEIAADLRMGKATLYYYYSTKEDIYKDVLRYEFDEFNNAVKNLNLSEEKDLKKKIYEYLIIRKSLYSDSNNSKQVLKDAIYLPHLIQDDSIYYDVIKTDEEFLRNIITEFNTKQKYTSDEINKYANIIAVLIRNLYFDFDIIKRKHSEFNTEIFIQELSETIFNLIKSK